MDTAGVITDVHQTTFRDTTLVPDAEYVYWIEVVNRGGLVVPYDIVLLGAWESGYWRCVRMT